MTRLQRFVDSPFAILVVLGLAFVLRVVGVSQWSLWEDEETSLYFSQNPGKPFPSYFPTFFLLLHGLFQLTGVSPAAGRLLAGAFGLLGIWLAYEFGRRFFSRSVGLLAAMFLMLALGHLFWSQSVRYYTLLAVFQVLCMLWFLDGLEKGSYRSLLLANVAFALALLTHFSGIILMPVLVGYTLLMIVRREDGAGYNLKSYLVFGIPFLAILSVFAWKFLNFQKLNLIQSLGATRVGQDLVGIAVRLALYFGMPVITLAILSALSARELPWRILLFLLVASLVPPLELIVIAQLDLAIVTWYYVLFSLTAFALLASITLVSLYGKGYRAVAVLAGSASVAYYAVFLFGYFTSMHGDRPRWQEAGAYLKVTAHVDPESPNNPDIYASVTGVVAYYLGVEPGQTMGQQLVKSLPEQPPSRKQAKESWFIVEKSVISDEYKAYFARSCRLEKQFEAKTGPKDRTILVYHCR